MHEGDNDEALDPREAALHRAIFERLPIANGPHIWVGAAADVEAGEPRGKWLIANQPVEDLRQDIRELVSRAATERAARDPRWAIYAQHGFGRHAPDAATPLSGVVERARRAREDLRAFNVWAQLGDDRPDWMAHFYDCYLGRYDRLRDWANLEVERAGWDRWLDTVLPPPMRLHVEINIDSLVHELVASGEVLSWPDHVSHGVFVFRKYEASLA